MPPDSLPRQSTACPTCGQAVEVSTTGDGTSHYVGIDAWNASTLRTERDAAILSATLELRDALRRALGGLRDTLGFIPADQPEHQRISTLLTANERVYDGAF